MKKRRPCARNYSSSQRHSRTHERLSIRTKSTHDSKGRGSRRSYPKLQQNNGQFDNSSRLKKDAFDSLESLFDIRKPLNLLDVYQLAFDYRNDKSVAEKSIDVFDIIKSEPLVETLYLQSLSPPANFELCINESTYFKEDVKNELKTSEELRTETSDFARKSQQNTSIYNKENYTVSMAEIEHEIPEEQQEEPVEQQEEPEEQQEELGEQQEEPEEQQEELGEQQEEMARMGEEEPVEDVAEIIEELGIEEIEEPFRVDDRLEEVFDIEGIEEQPEQEEMRDRIVLPREYPVDKLPKIIVCGHKEDNLPRIVVAESKRERTREDLERLTGQLAESLTMQERLVTENVQLECGKYILENALLERDEIIETLERKLDILRQELRRVDEENRLLNIQQQRSYEYSAGQPQLLDVTPEELDNSMPEQPQPLIASSPIAQRLTGGGSATETPHFKDNIPQNVGMYRRGVICTKASAPQGTCLTGLVDKLTTHDTCSKQLEQQLGTMQSEIRSMQVELANVQRERLQLEQQNKLLKCTGPCAPCDCRPLPSTCVTPSALKKSVSPKRPAAPTSSTVMTAQTVPPKCTGSCTDAPMGTSTCVQQQLRDLREQYARLQEDYKNKLCEVSCMRTDAEKMKQDLRDAKEEKERVEIKMIDVQERLKFLEEDRGNFEGYKEQMIEQEQALIVAKQRMRETQDELEELRSATQDLSIQLEDYRNKYLQAQQQVEEQRRQMDLMEMDNARMNENVTLEIGRVKNQFQEKLAELAPLPEILKQSQTKLQETQQIRLIAERNCEDLSRELQGHKDKLQIQQNEMEVLRTQYQTLLGERGQGTGRFDEIEKKYGELRNENERMKNTLTRLEEQKAQLQKRMDEKMHENAQLLSQLDQVREESARQVARTKERCENVRHSMQRQIAEMERELAQCRATTRAAQRDRDEIRQKMQGQINNLNEAFEQAQGRIRSLQGHVNYLKTSYSNMLIDQKEIPTGVPTGDAPGLGYDSCDCNY